jgi:hypothetical protein
MGYNDINNIWLVVTGTWLLFFHILGIVTPTDRGVGTTNQILLMWEHMELIAL